MYDAVSLRVFISLAPCAIFVTSRSEAFGDQRDMDDIYSHRPFVSIPHPCSSSKGISLQLVHPPKHETCATLQPQKAGSPLLPRRGAPRDTAFGYLNCFAISDYHIGHVRNCHRVISSIYQQKAWQPRSSPRAP